MKIQNIKALENLSVFCHFSGLISIVIGLGVIFINLFTSQINDIPVGIFIFSTGYSFVKIAAKISMVIMDEKRFQY